MRESFPGAICTLVAANSFPDLRASLSLISCDFFSPLPATAPSSYPTPTKEHTQAAFLKAVNMVRPISCRFYYDPVSRMHASD